MYLAEFYIACIWLACLISPTWSFPLLGERFDQIHHDRPRYNRPLLHPQYCNHSNYEQRNFNTIESIYNLTIYPNQLPILGLGASAVPAGLFNENATGRVDPVGNFTGFDDSIEYFFALAPVPFATPSSAAITSIKITEFSSGCPSVAASVVYLFCSIEDSSSENNRKALAPLKEVAFWKFDEYGAVLKYDAWIPNLNSWINATLGIEISNPRVAAASIAQVCATTQQMCTGSNTQWSSADDCVATLSQKPYGNYDEAWGDNVVCRTIHLILTQVRPQVHCPHVGPSGGSKCVDIPYPQDYFNDQALYGDSLGNTFTCPRSFHHSI